jgi:hypothetical protein
MLAGQFTSTTTGIDHQEQRPRAGRSRALFLSSVGSQRTSEWTALYGWESVHTIFDSTVVSAAVRLSQVPPGGDE